MKKLLPFIFAVATTPAYADITAKYVTSAQISIDSPYVITNAAPSSYSISGNNITTSTGTGDSVVTNGIGGLNLGSFDNNGLPNAIHTNKTVTTAGSAFSLAKVIKPVTEHKLLLHLVLVSQLYLFLAARQQSFLAELLVTLL